MAAATSVPHDVASQPTLVHALMKAAELSPDRTALLDKDEAGDYTRRTTAAEFVDTARALAESLAALGLQKHERVAIWAENSREWNLADVATAMNRAATVGVYLNDSLEDVVFKISDAGARVVFTDSPERLERLGAIPETELPTVEAIVGFPGAGTDGSVLSFEELLARDGTDVGDRIDALLPDDPAKIMYTSGTTSRPKGAVVSHRNLLANTVGTSQVLAIEPDSVLISYLPNAHIFQALMDYVAWLNGCCLGYSSKHTLKADLPRLRPHMLPGVPKVFKMLLQAMARLTDALSGGEVSFFADDFSRDEWADLLKEKVGLSRITCCLSGAARLDDDTIRLYEEKLGLTIDQGYGISEASGGVSIGGPGNRKLGKCGRPIPGLQLKVVDAARRPVGTGVTGEIVIKGPMVFSEYLNKPDATRAVLDGGWYHTGDRGTVDDEGFVEVLGRVGHRVKFANGEYYDLDAIGENFLRQAALIGQIVVAGEYRDYPVALVTLAEDLLAAQSAAARLGIAFSAPVELVYHTGVVGAVREEFERIREAGEFRHPLERVQKAIYLRPFTADNGEATPTQKTRIRFVLDKYETEIAGLYGSDDSFRVLQV